MPVPAHGHVSEPNTGIESKEVDGITDACLTVFIEDGAMMYGRAQITGRCMVRGVRAESMATTRCTTMPRLATAPIPVARPWSVAGLKKEKIVCSVHTFSIYADS